MDELESYEQSAEVLNFADALRDSLVSGVLAVDAQGKVCAFNSEAQRLTQVASEAILGQPARLLPRELADLVAERSHEGVSVADREIHLEQGDGSTLALRASVTACLDDHGRSRGVVVVLHNPTAAHKLQHTIQRLDRLASIGTMSASMAHEIKNALVAVNTFVEDLLQRNKDSELAGLVSREIRRIDAIVSQMLKFASPAKPTFARVSVQRMLEQSLHLIQPQLQSKHIRLRRSFAARRDVIEGDDYQLEQAFLNILLNAVAAMEPNGVLSVATELAELPPTVDDSASMPEQIIQVSITDTGPGIPQENLGRLFEPFFSTKPQGTGLGLAITKRITVEHRGRIAVESELGKGATFRISLPLAK